MKFLTLIAAFAFVQGPDLSLATGTVKVDGSSTVFPITEAVAEEYGAVDKKVRVTVGVSGTGGGFKKFAAGEIDINDASRPIKKEEAELAKKNKIDFIELPVAFDGLTVVVSQQNDFVDQLTVAELKKIWEPGSKVKKWKDVRPNFPDVAIKLYGPGPDSGTFDYFTEAINGKAQASRGDYSKSEDDNVLVTGVSGDKYALGYFGFAYFEENQKKLKAVPIVGKSGKAVSPSVTTINDGSYEPLSRPIFIYVNKASLKRPEVKGFVEFYLNEVEGLVREVGYIPLPKDQYAKGKDTFKKAL
jgi:phosphate transport system substrate-binding protein